MKFTENTQISEIIDLIHNDWKSFKQDLQCMKIVTWLKNHHRRDEEANLLETQLHKDWVSLYPHIATLRVFEVLQHINKVDALQFISNFKNEHSNEIEKEIKEFRLLGGFVDSLQGKKTIGGKPIIGFLLISDDNQEHSVYILYEGENYFGSGSYPNDQNFQFIVTSERLLVSKHFCIEGTRTNGLKFKVLADANGFVKGSNKNFKNGSIEYRDSLVLGSLKITVLDNYN